MLREGHVMKIKITNKELQNYNEIFKVQKMYYDFVVVEDQKGKSTTLKRGDVKFIPEYEQENILLKCKDIVKIKLDKGMTMLFYKALINCIEENINKKVKAIIVLKDNYRVIRRGLWEKSLLLVINDEIPLEIKVVGKNYDVMFDINIRNLKQEEFLEQCDFDMEQINMDIDSREKLIKTYKKTIKKVLNKQAKGNNIGIEGEAAK